VIIPAVARWLRALASRLDPPGPVRLASVPRVPCGNCGGPTVKMMPWTQVRTCPGAVGLIVGGETVTHLGPGEAARIAQELDDGARHVLAHADRAEAA